MKKPRFTLLQIIVHIGGWTPLALLVYDFFTNQLTANPIQAIEQKTGIHALTFLLYSLACTPVSSIFGWRELTQRRKALGNYAFLYATLHVTTFFWLDYGLNLLAIWRDVGTKWYILIGLTAFLMLIPLAFTSFNYWMKRLGKNWKRLHKMIYIIVPLVAIHFLLAVKGDLFQLSGNIIQPVLYGSIALILLTLRISPVKHALIGLRTRIMLRLRGAKPAEEPQPTEPPLKEKAAGGP